MTLIMRLLQELSDQTGDNLSRGYFNYNKSTNKYYQVTINESTKSGEINVKNRSCNWWCGLYRTSRY